jgi:hypothetical protein
MDVVIIVLAILALVAGIIGEVEGMGRNWAAWGVICLAAIALIGLL